MHASTKAKSQRAQIYFFIVGSSCAICPLSKTVLHLAVACSSAELQSVTYQPFIDPFCSTTILVSIYFFLCRDFLLSLMNISKKRNNINNLTIAQLRPSSSLAEPEKPYLYLALVCLSLGWSVMLCSSALEPATDKFYTVLERGQIVHEDSGIKNIIYY